MIDTQDYLIPLQAKKALLVSDSDWGLNELDGLLTTMGGYPEERLLLPKRPINAGTYVGAGKLQEIANILNARNLDLLLVDFDLSPSQLKNIEQATKKLVLDRSGIILEIFNRHAQTKEAKLQVELARLAYLMPRLTNLWSHLERQKGSGGGALKGKGMGEKQIEVDRRLIKDRMTMLKRKLKEVEGARNLHRKNRESILKVALVGYTNAGKSTLLNALTHSDVLVENALFATLDASVRLLNPKSRPIVLAIDTVGFIDRLPHGLVASFRSTLGEVLEADLLIHVLDASDPEVKRHFDVTMSVLNELGAVKYEREGSGDNGEVPRALLSESESPVTLPDGTVVMKKKQEEAEEAKQNIPMLIVFNKMDQCTNPPMVKIWGKGLSRQYAVDEPLYISAHDTAQVDEARARIMKYFDHLMETYEVLVPFEDGKTVAQIHELGNVETKRATEKGTFFRLRTLPAFANQINLGRYKV